VNTSPDADNRSEAPQGDRRLSTLVGDRICTRCGYNLTGQPVVREAHYEMLIVRCPECGTVASLQEYPVLGRWAGRWAALLAALWVVVVLGLLLASGGILMGIGERIAHGAVVPWALYVAERQHEEFKAQQDQGTLSQAAEMMAQTPPSASSFLEPTWVSQQDFDAMLREAGGRAAVLDYAVLRSLVWLVVAAFPMGCVWAVVFLHLKRGRRVLLGLLPIAVAGVFLAIARLGAPNTLVGWGWMTVDELARRQVGLPVAIGALAFSILPLAAGLVVGRHVMRGTIRALLPPRLRSSLALLWTVDGLEPPN
jgi:hypothetical protein